MYQLGLMYRHGDCDERRRMAASTICKQRTVVAQKKDYNVENSFNN